MFLKRKDLPEIGLSRKWSASDALSTDAIAMCNKNQKERKRKEENVDGKGEKWDR